MEKIYEFMERNLEIEKKVSSFLYTISKLEQAYSEEEQKEEKYLANTVRWMFLQVQKDLKDSIQEMDAYIVAEKGK